MILIAIYFDNQSALINIPKLNIAYTVNIKSEYLQKYCIMVDMVTRVCNDECKSSQIDGLINQIETLKWLIKLDEKV